MSGRQHVMRMLWCYDVADFVIQLPVLTLVASCVLLLLQPVTQDEQSSKKQNARQLPEMKGSQANRKLHKSCCLTARQSVPAKKWQAHPILLGPRALANCTHFPPQPQEVCWDRRRATESEMQGELKKQASAAGEEMRKARQEASELQHQTHQLTTDLAAANEKLTSSASTLADRDRCSFGGCVMHELREMLLNCLHSCVLLDLHQGRQRAA